MKTYFKVYAAVVLTIIAGCSLLTKRTDTVSTETMRGLVIPVCNRHDQFVLNDQQLDAQPVAIALAESKACIAAVMTDEKEIVVAEIRAPLNAVLDRHDAYVEQQIVDPRDSNDFLRSSELLRKLMDQAAKGH